MSLRFVTRKLAIKRVVKSRENSCEGKKLPLKFCIVYPPLLKNTNSSQLKMLRLSSANKELIDLAFLQI